MRISGWSSDVCSSDLSDRAGGPVPVEARILYAGDKSYIGTGPMRANAQVALGPTALLAGNGIVVSVTTVSTTAIEEDPFVQRSEERRGWKEVPVSVSHCGCRTIKTQTEQHNSQ